MPITLPPAITPENVPVAEIRGHAREYAVIALGSTRVHVLGADLIAREVLEDRVTAARSLSEAIYAVQGALYQAGYPAARIRYALAEPDLYVLVLNQPLTTLEIPAPYTRFFSGLVDEPVLDDRAIEPGRILASMHADRAGLRAALALRPTPGGSALGLNVEPVNGPRAHARACMGNPGNRFIGRYFADYGGQYSTLGGDEFLLGGRHALSGLNQRDGGGAYREHSLGYSRVTSQGIAGITARDLDYSQHQAFPGFPAPLALDGKLQQVEATWLGIPVAGFDRRWSLSYKLDYTYKELRAEEFEPLLQKQEYASLEFGTDYTMAVQLAGQAFQFGTALSIRHGLGPERSESPLVLADLGYTLLRPGLSLSTTFGNDVRASIALGAQLSADRVPEQQQWVVGGAGNLEAFLPGVMIGDSGGLARFQLGFPGWEFGRWKLIPNVFTEYAQVRLDAADGTQQKTSAAAADLGAALVLNWRKRIDATLACATPLMDRGISDHARDDADAGLVFRLSLAY